MAATLGRALALDGEEDGDWAGIRGVRRSMAAWVQKTLRFVGIVSERRRRKSITVVSWSAWGLRTADERPTEQ